MNDLYAALLSWAVTLSGYPAPAVPPEVVKVSHAFFVEHACNKQECKVWGWYAGGTKLYIDERFDPATSVLASSVVVHEMVHYLQSVNRGDDKLPAGQAFGVKPTCEQSIRWEREAYAVQQEFIYRQGTYLPVGASMIHAHCTAS